MKKESDEIRCFKRKFKNISYQKGSDKGGYLYESY